METYSEFQKETETALRLKPIFSAVPILGYCFAIDEKFPFSASMEVTPVSEEQLDALLHPPLFQQQFSFPTYPMIPAENEQIRPFPAVTWHHVTPWSVKPPQGSFALDPFTLSASSDISTGELCEYGGVERSLLSWEQAEVKEHNAHPDHIMDSFLYAIPPLEKNRFTAIPERYALTNSFCLSVSVNKSSDPSDSSRKKARKRIREGEEEEKTSPESISAVIYQRIRWNWKWTRKEDEMLCALVMQFGTGWYFICSVFLLENVWKTKTRGIYQQRWKELTEHKKVVDAVIPTNLKYVWIPRQTLATQRNPYFAYSYPFLMHSVPKQQTTSSNPIDSLFSSVRTKQVKSSLFETLPMDETEVNELKKRDSLFATYETDKLKRLQRYMRPETPVHPSKDMIRHASSTLRSVSSFNGNGSLSTLESVGKTHGGRVSVRFFPIPKPADFLAKRMEAIRSLPIAIMYINDPSQFQHLLGGHRHPQDGIVVPYDTALAQGQRILEESTKQRLIPMEMEKVEVEANRNDSETASTVSQGKSQCPDYLEGLRDYLECMPGSPREIQNELQASGDVGELKETSGNEELIEAPVLEDVWTEKVEESPLAPSIRQYPFIPFVIELSSQSVKRPSMEEFEESINLKQQKIPRSSMERMKRLIPSTPPHAFYVSVSQHTRSNNRLLQKYLSAKKKQMRNPKLFVPPLSSISRKDAMMGREVQEVVLRAIGNV